LENKSKSFWNIIKEESGKNKNAAQMPLILNSNNTITHLHQAADVFNKYFLTLIDRTKLYYTDTVVL